MPIIVTMNNSGSRLSKVSGDWSARESWIVTGTFDKNTAIESACAHDAVHADNVNMRAGHRDAENVAGSPECWHVWADFTFGDHGLCADSPIHENPKIIWEPDRIVTPVDRDLSLNPILNSASDPLAPPATRPIPIVALVIRKALPVFNVAISLSFQDHTNSNAFTIVGAGGVDVGQAYCDYVRPTEMYTLAAPWVWVEYRIQLRGGAKPFQFYPQDVGRSGFYTDAVGTHKGPIVDASGNPVPYDVRLNGKGKPIDAGLSILDFKGEKQEPVENPVIPTGLTIDAPRSSATNKTLFWPNIPEIDFSGLGL